MIHWSDSCGFQSSPWHPPYQFCSISTQHTSFIITSIFIITKKQYSSTSTQQQKNDCSIIFFSPRLTWSFLLIQFVSWWSSTTTAAATTTTSTTTSSSSPFRPAYRVKLCKDDVLCLTAALLLFSVPIRRLRLMTLVSASVSPLFSACRRFSSLFSCVWVSV